MHSLKTVHNRDGIVRTILGEILNTLGLVVTEAF